MKILFLYLSLIKRIKKESQLIFCSLIGILYFSATPALANQASDLTAAWSSDGYFPMVDEISLEELVHFSLAESPSVIEGSLQTEMAEAMLDEAKGGWLPKVSVNTGRSLLGSNNNTDYGLQVNQLLYDFGKTGYQIDAASHNLVVNQYQKRIISKNIVLQTALYYLEIKRFEQLILAMGENIRNLEKLHSMASLRVNAGVTTQSDVLQIKSRISSMETILIGYQANHDVWITKISVLSGVAANRYQAFQHEKFDISSLQSIQLSTLPEMLIAEANLNVAQNDLKAAQSAKLPTIDMTLDINKKDDTSSSDWDKQIYVNLNYPIYQGGVLTAQAKQASARVSIAKQNLQQAKLDIIQSSKIALREFESAKRLKNESAIQNSTAKKAKDIYQDEYLLGKRSLNDLLTAEQDLVQAIQAEVNAHFDGLMAAINYLSIRGELLNVIKHG
ncbi:MAG: TolC family protein [Vibrio sp.]|uniref:TolC family protein n=1 Tax=Vibrio sp. TaxID=678 RepID=UPI003A84E652